MHIATHNSELKKLVSTWHRQGERVAFVPTMGSLHEGHLSLVEHARGEADRVVASIFVNPLQFGPGEDYETYPRTFKEDQLALEEADADLLYAPSVDEIYPYGANIITRVEVADTGDILCGKFRPGFFTGVATVVAKLFHLVQPDVAVFGKKDYQQLIIIRRMVEDLNWPIEIVGVETKREPGGLAMSSRNRYLSQAQRVLAPRLYHCLQTIADRIIEGERGYAAIELAATKELTDAGFLPDYVSVLRALDLTQPGPHDQHLIALVAARLGKARLIDNIEISVT